MMLLLFLGCLPAQPAEIVMDDFPRRLMAVRRLETVVSRPELVLRYKQLIADFPKHEERAHAMLLVAHRMECEDLAVGMRADYDEAVVWFRQAAAAAPGESKWWPETHFLLASRIKFKNPDEARGILESIRANRPKDFLALVRVVAALGELHSMAGDIGGAIDHCKQILNWYKQPGNIPTELCVKAEIDSYIRSAGVVLMQQYLMLPMSKAERRELITSFMTAQQWPPFQIEGKRALEQLNAMPEYISPESKSGLAQ